jgi:GDP-4-dehydro-6-deoxy-D-mannose reductase
MARALVIGANGFVGRHLITHLKELGDEVVRAGLNGTGSLEDDFLSVDITDSRSVRSVVQQIMPDVTYHLAGIAFVPEAEEDFDRVLRINVAGTANVVRQCHLLEKKTSLVFISSAEVYGSIKPEDLPLRETTPIKPNNNYSLSKRMAEMIVERYARAGHLSCCIVRPFNHIGPGQDRRFVTANFALQLARIAHGKADPILRVGNLEARRDFSDVRDIVRGYRLLSQTRGGLFNLGSGRASSVQTILDTLIEVSGVRVEIVQDPERMRGPEVPELYGSCVKIQEACGWAPEISLRRSLQDVYQYWSKQVELGLA